MRRCVKPCSRRVSILDVLKTDSIRPVKGAVAPVVTKHNLDDGVHFQLSAMVTNTQSKVCETRLRYCFPKPFEEVHVRRDCNAEMQGAEVGLSHLPLANQWQPSAFSTSRKVQHHTSQAIHTAMASIPRRLLLQSRQCTSRLQCRASPKHTARSFATTSQRLAKEPLQDNSYSPVPPAAPTDQLGAVETAAEDHVAQKMSTLR